jgi:hypothetical protein
MIETISDEKLLKEYYEIFFTVNDYDKRLLTVKGWGVTLSLAALAWGFQDSHFGLFLVAALSGLGFWIIEGTLKRHQMRYYLRMREIEVLQYERIELDRIKSLSSPRIDFSWFFAGGLYNGKELGVNHPIPFEGPYKSYKFVWFYPHVFLPHLVSFLAGLVLFLLGLNGILGEMNW